MYGVDAVEFGMCVTPKNAPDAAEIVTITFKNGMPMAVNGKKKSPAVGIHYTPYFHLNEGISTAIHVLDGYWCRDRFLFVQKELSEEEQGKTTTWLLHSRYLDGLSAFAIYRFRQRASSVMPSCCCTSAICPLNRLASSG